MARKLLALSGMEELLSSIIYICPSPWYHRRGWNASMHFSWPTTSVTPRALDHYKPQLSNQNGPRAVNTRTHLVSAHYGFSYCTWRHRTFPDPYHFSWRQLARALLAQNTPGPLGLCLIWVYFGYSPAVLLKTLCVEHLETPYHSPYLVSSHNTYIPLVLKRMGHTGLHLLQLQLSCHSSLCMKSPGTPQAHTHFSSSHSLEQFKYGKKWDLHPLWDTVPAS